MIVLKQMQTLASDRWSQPITFLPKFAAMGKDVEYDTTLALSSRPLRREAQTQFPHRNRVN